MSISSVKYVCYTWAGLTIRVVDAPQIIEKAMEKMFALCRTPADDRGVDVRMVLQENDTFFDAMPSSVQKPYEAMRENGNPVIRVDPDGGFTVLAKESAAGSYAVCRPPFKEFDLCSQTLTNERSPLLFNSVLIPVIRELLLRRGKALLHAGCVVTREGDGLIIVADSGGGKTTTSIALAREGFRLVSDDLVALSKSQEGIRVEGIRKPMNVNRRTISLFPELSYLASDLRKSTHAKIPVDPIEVFGLEKIATTAWVSAIFFTQVDRHGPRLVPMNVGEALKPLLKSHTFAASGPVAQESLDILWPLLESARSFRLITGYAPKRLGQLMAKEASRGRFGRNCALQDVEPPSSESRRRQSPKRAEKCSVSRLRPAIYCKLTRQILNYTLEGGDGGKPGSPNLITESVLLATWEMMRRHRIETHMAKWLRETPDTPESVALIDPEGIISRATVLSMSLQAAAARIFDRLSLAGIPAMMLRGPALAVQYYPEPYLRHCRDVDVICNKEDLPRAEEVLLKLGYRPIGDRGYWNRKGEWPFSDGRHTVELHWDAYPVMRTCVPRPAALARFWDESVTTRIDGSAVPCLGPNHLLLSSCLHASWEHKLDRLVRLVDLRQIIKMAYGQLDWNWIVRQTIDSGNVLAVGLSLRCAAELVEAPVPEHVLKELKPAGLREWMGTVSMSPLALIGSRGVVAKIRRSLFHLALKANRYDKNGA